MNVESFHELYINQLRELYDNESQLVLLLPELVANAHHQTLKKAFQRHLSETKEQQRRLAKLLERMDKDPQGETSKAMQGLVKEARAILAAHTAPDVRDSGLIAAAQRIEHVKIANYGTAVAYARQLGDNQASSLLRRALEEAKEMDRRLTTLAVHSINEEAQHEVNGLTRQSSLNPSQVILWAVGVGAVAGAVLGLILAPDRGVVTRRRLAGTTKDWIGQLGTWANVVSDTMSRATNSVKTKITQEAEPATIS